MIQEYLLLDNTEKEAIKNYKPDKVQVEMFFANTGEWGYIQFSADNENEETAKRLSDVDEYVNCHFKVTTLESGCSEYFNKRLYTLVSRFECKLRKLLYLTSAINKDDESAANIKDLESQDFGQIFTLLFIDNEFMSKVKDSVKNRNKEQFSKAEVLALIEATDENTLWEALLGKDAVPTLRKRFNDVRSYRNDVMHSHYINWEKYRAIQKLYRTINSELDKSVHDIEVTESEAPSRPTFNHTLEGALRAQEQLSKLQIDFEQIQKLANFYTYNPEFVALQERIKEMSAVYTMSPEIERLQEQMKELATIKIDIPPALQKMQEITKSLKIPKIDIPPELLKLQRSLSELSFPPDSDNSDEKKTENVNPENGNFLDDERVK